MKTIRSLALALVATLTFTVSVKHPTAPSERPTIVLVSEAQAVTSGVAAWGANTILNHLYRNISYTLPAHLYVGLIQGTTPSTNAAATTAVGANEVNPNGTSYQRVDMVAASTPWGAPALNGDGQQITNSVSALTFPAPTGNWCSGATYCTTAIIMDAQCTNATTCGNGNLLMWFNLTAQKNVNSGDAAPSFALSSVTIKLAQLFPLDLELALMAANEPMVIEPADIHLAPANEPVPGTFTISDAHIERS